MGTLLHPEIYSCLVFKFESAMDKTVEKKPKEKTKKQTKNGLFRCCLPRII